MFLKTVSAINFSSSSEHRHTRRFPDLPFFMITGTVYTSFAPFSIRSSAAYASSSPLISSISHSSFTMRSISPLPVSPENTLTQLAFSNFFLPKPYPHESVLITGMAPKLSAKYLRIAAPVGVQSSPCISPPYIGTFFRIYAVAGAGTGSMPCAHLTLPAPTCIEETITLSAPISLNRRQAAVTSATASIVPTS